MRPGKQQGPQQPLVPQPRSSEKVAPQDGQEANHRLTGGLRLLADSYRYACELGRDRWDFALEVVSLHRAGLINNDLRWLIAKGYLEHGIEKRPGDKDQRVFRRVGGLRLSRRSSFVLTDAGVQWCRQVLAASDGSPGVNGGEEQQDKRQMSGTETPYWDAEEHTLYWRGQVVKHFKREAPWQEAILTAFQESSWARYVTVMLPKDEGVNPKDRLRETIKNLNRSCGGRIRFTQEGNGSRVGWKLFP